MTAPANQLGQVNMQILQAAGMDHLAERLRSCTITLHPRDWPTARLEMVIDQATGRTERVFVSVVPQEHPATPVALPGFDLEAECNRARRAVHETIENAAEQAQFACMRSFRAISFPRFELQRLPYQNQHTWQPANQPARAAFMRYTAAVAQLDLLSTLHRLQRLREGGQILVKATGRGAGGGGSFPRNEVNQ